MTFELTLYDALLSIEVPADKAKAVIDALEHDMVSTLATKQDIGALASETRQEFVLVRQEIQALASETRQEFALVRQEIQALASETKQEFALVRQETQALRHELEHRIDLLQSTMTIRLGSIMVVSMGLLFAALKLT
jgi:hypothetical protein